MNPFLIPCALYTIHSILSISHLLVEKRRMPLSYQPSVPFFNKTLKTASFLYMGIAGFWMLTESSVVWLQVWFKVWALISWSRWITYKLYDQCRKIHRRRQPISECSPDRKFAWQFMYVSISYLAPEQYLMKCRIQWGTHLFASVLLMRCVHEKQTHSSQITVRCSRKHITGLCKNRQEQEQAAFTSLELSKQPSSLALFTMGLMLIV